MCGIIAINCNGNSEYFIDKALQTISHRGPDDSGVFLSEKKDCQLGHVRLAIMDLSSSGHQPMFNSSKQFVISYNGEVYNFEFLKAELEARYGSINWKSSSDTEVILEGFAREGVEFLKKLNGIFALSIYDVFSEKMYVLRILLE
jgi:asparagine synthase (glutamine-hydrolysing)